MANQIPLLIFLMFLSFGYGREYKSNGRGNYQKQKQCDNLTSPVSLESDQLLYVNMIQLDLIKEDAKAFNDNNLDIENYCGRVLWTKDSLKVTEWGKSIEITSLSNFQWNTYKPVVLNAPGITDLKETLGRFFSHPKGLYSIVVIGGDGPITWAVNTPTTKRLSKQEEQDIFTILNIAGLDTSKVFRTDFSKCGYPKPDDVKY